VLDPVTQCVECSVVGPLHDAVRFGRNDGSAL
jgi:hypothetical protein